MHIGLPIGSFYADLIGKNQKLYKESLSSTSSTDQGLIDWIKKSLQTPIDDFRKCSRDLSVLFCG